MRRTEQRVGWKRRSEEKEIEREKKTRNETMAGRKHRSRRKKCPRKRNFYGAKEHQRKK